jgi:hypothetical protein
MGELLPYGKYSNQTQGARHLDTQQTQVLHLARLEEARTEKEEPDPVRYSQRSTRLPAVRNSRNLRSFNYPFLNVFYVS